MNFRFGAVGLLIGWVNVNMDFVVNENWTLGPELNFWRITTEKSGSLTEDIKWTYVSAGARANWFANGAFTDGLYVGPALKLSKLTLESADSTGDLSAEGTVLIAEGIVVYGWFWDSFNMMLGGGIGLPLGATDLEFNDSSGTSHDKSYGTARFAGEFTLGWTF